MSSETDPLNNKVRKPTTTFRWAIRRGRQRLPIVRLGSKNPRRGFLRRVKLNWLRLKYSCMLKKLKKYYDSLMKEMKEGRGVIESFQQRLLLESSFAVPVMGLSLNTYTPPISSYGVHERTYSWS